MGRPSNRELLRALDNILALDAVSRSREESIARYRVDIHTCKWRGVAVKMSENTQNEVKVEDIEPDVLEEMLKFVYTGEVTHLQEMAIPLLYTSELKRLKALC